MAAIVELHPGSNRHRPHHDLRGAGTSPRSQPASDAAVDGHDRVPCGGSHLHLVAPLQGVTPVRAVTRHPVGPLSSSRLRLVLVVAGALLVVVGAARSVGAVADWAVGAVPPPPPADLQVYVVEPGDTMWSIARSLHPDGDVRPLVDRLIEINGGAELRAGDVLELRW